VIATTVGLPRVATALRRLAAVRAEGSPRSATRSQSTSNGIANVEAPTGDGLPSLLAGLTWADTVEITRIIS